jgi:hypothetical protein
MTRLTADLFPRRSRHPNRKTSEYSAICTAEWGRGSIFSRGWGSSARTDTHLNYMTGVALTAEFSLATAGVR